VLSNSHWHPGTTILKTIAVRMMHGLNPSQFLNLHQANDIKSDPWKFGLSFSGPIMTGESELPTRV